MNTELQRLRSEAEKTKCEKVFSEKFQFSSENKDGKFLKKDQDAFVQFYSTLTDDQRKQFSTLIGSIQSDLNAKFSEIGGDGVNVGEGNGAESKDELQKFSEAASRIAKEQNIPLHEAQLKVTKKDLQ
jgi:hypothetical protein